MKDKFLPFSNKNNLSRDKSSPSFSILHLVIHPEYLSAWHIPGFPVSFIASLAHYYGVIRQ